MFDGHDFAKVASVNRALILLDEGDYYVKEHMLVSDGTAEPKGLFALRKCKVYMFTATMPDYWLRCVTEVFKVGSVVALVKVPSALEVI